MSIHLLYGEERFLLDKALLALRSSKVDPAWEAFCYQKLQAPSLSQLVETLSTVRFALGGTGDTLLEVRECAALFEAPKTASEEAALTQLLKHVLPNLEPTRHIVFVSTKIDKKFKLSKWLTTAANGVNVLEFALPPFWQPERVVQALCHAAKEEGIPIQPQAAELLVESQGFLLLPLLQEVRKLDLLREGKPIDAHLVRQVCQLQENTFRFFEDWLLRRQPQLRLETLMQLMQGNAPMGLFYQFRGLLDTALKLRFYRQQKVDFNTLAQKLGKKPTYLQNVDKTLAPVATARLWRLYKQATDLEWRFKRGLINDQLALELWLAS